MSESADVLRAVFRRIGRSRGALSRKARQNAALGHFDTTYHDAARMELASLARMLARWARALKIIPVPRLTKIRPRSIKNSSQ